MSEISYIRVKPSRFARDYTVRDASIVSALIYLPKANPVNMSNLEKLAIYVEQHILADYLLSASENKVIRDYRDKVKTSFNIKKAEVIKSHADISKLVSENYFTEYDLNTIFSYFEDPNSVPPARMVKLVHALDKCKFDRCSFMNNFYEPYFSQKEFLNPVLLTPAFSFKKNKDANDRSPITLLPTAYTKNTYRKVNINKDIDNNRFYTYFLNMDFNNVPWQSIVDTLQKFSLSSSIESLSTLPGLLSKYLTGRYIPGIVDKKRAKNVFLSIFNYIDKYNTLSVTDTHPEELVRLMAILFADDRLGYLLIKDPELSATEAWNRCTELACFTKFGVEAAEGEADDSDDEGDDDSGDDSEDAEGDEDTGDEEGSDDDFGDDEGGEGDDDFGDFGDDEGGDDDGDSGGDSDEGSEDEADPEDVNPLIQIIENESFDEYLERGAIEKKLLAIFNNPPAKLSANQLNTMKFWYTQWFPLVSIETTKKILGSLLDIEVETEE